MKSKKCKSCGKVFVPNNSQTFICKDKKCKALLKAYRAIQSAEWNAKEAAANEIDELLEVMLNSEKLQELEEESKLRAFAQFMEDNRWGI